MFQYCRQRSFVEFVNLTGPVANLNCINKEIIRLKYFEKTTQILHTANYTVKLANKMQITKCIYM